MDKPRKRRLRGPPGATRRKRRPRAGARQSQNQSSVNTNRNQVNVRVNVVGSAPARRRRRRRAPAAPRGGIPPTAPFGFGVNPSLHIPQIPVYGAGQYSQLPPPPPPQAQPIQDTPETVPVYTRTGGSGQNRTYDHPSVQERRVDNVIYNTNITRYDRVDNAQFLNQYSGGTATPMAPLVPEVPPEAVQDLAVPSVPPSIAPPATPSSLAPPQLQIESPPTPQEPEQDLPPSPPGSPRVGAKPKRVRDRPSSKRPAYVLGGDGIARQSSNSSQPAEINVNGWEQRDGKSSKYLYSPDGKRRFNTETGKFFNITVRSAKPVINIVRPTPATEPSRELAIINPSR